MDPKDNGHRLYESKWKCGCGHVFPQHSSFCDGCGAHNFRRKAIRVPFTGGSSDYHSFKIAEDQRSKYARR